MKRILSIFGLAILSFQYAAAFQSPVEIARINDQSIWSDELLYAFQKNRKADSPVNEDSLLNYLQRYINFKLKVQAARNLGTDTTLAFRQEYESYISQVSKPYMDNPNKIEDLVAEAYERSKFEVRASHILIRVASNASPSDTLKAYQKADSLRNLANNGIDFGLMARQNTADSNGDKGGDLGWFTVFGMVYPFETGVYSTEVGKVSNIVKTQFGYHLIKVTDRRTARGKVRTSHIFIARSKHSENEGRGMIERAYDSLQAGADWNRICQRFSEDVQSKKNNGALPMAGIGQLPLEYLDHAYPIKEVGDYTKPVVTPYGWHIIRLDDRQLPPAFETQKGQLAEGVRRSGRLQYGEQEVLNKLKKQNEFQGFSVASTKAVDSLKKYLGQVENIPAYDNELLFNIGDKAFYVADFFNHLTSLKSQNVSNFGRAYRDFEQSALFAYEDSLALIKYPEYRLLLQEYEEGLLLFDIMEDEVWNRALSDSIGLQKYFESNKSNYPAPERAATYVINNRTSQKPDLLNQVHTILSGTESGTDPREVLKSRLTSTEYSLLKIVKRTFTQDDLPIFAAGNWTENQLIFSDAKERLYYISSIKPEGNYQLSEIRGKVTANYQDYLDEEWIAQLRQKSNIKVFKRKLASLLPLD